MTKSKQKPIILDTDTALQIARKILTQFHNGESFDNARIEQNIQQGRNEDPYCKITIDFEYLNQDQLQLLNDILADSKDLHVEVRDSTVEIYALSDVTE